MVEGFNAFSVDALDKCLVPNMVIPPKFEVLGFKKYKGLSCLRNHLQIFYMKMVAYAYDEKLVIHFF